MSEDVLFLSKKDVRSENRELAFKMVFREIKEACRYDLMRISASGGPMFQKPLRDIIGDILKRYEISEQEIGSSLSLAISFPDDVARNQWFIGADGNPVARFVDKKLPAPLKVKKKGKRKR